MKMKAAVLFEVNQDMAIEEVEFDDPKDGEVLLRIANAGVCHSDLSVAAVPMCRSSSGTRPRRWSKRPGQASAG